MDPPPVESAADVCSGSRAKAELTLLISRLMEGDEPQTLRRKYGSELVEEAISVLEHRI